MFHVRILYKILGSIWLETFKIVSPIYEYKNLNIKKNSINEKKHQYYLYDLTSVWWQEKVYRHKTCI